MELERWKLVRGFAGLYEISDRGRLRGPSGKILRPGTTGRNSSAIHHCLVGKKKSAYGFTWSRA